MKLKRRIGRKYWSKRVFVGAKRLSVQVGSFYSRAKNVR